MKRFVLQQLIEWKNREDRKPLILNGARQVGKTWLLHEFAKLEYKKEAYVVCRKNNLARQLFSQDFNVDRILRGLRAMTSVDITPGDTLIILDEIQDIPEALESLKYFKEEVPEYHIAVAGSLLGISLHQDVSYPVGKVNVINIFPMNFEEFLVAKGEEEACKLLMSGDFETISLLHDKYTDLLRQYYYVGGMPEVVLKYVETDSLLEVRRIQSEIFNVKMGGVYTLPATADGTGSWAVGDWPESSTGGGFITVVQGKFIEVNSNTTATDISEKTPMLNIPQKLTAWKVSEEATNTKIKADGAHQCYLSITCKIQQSGGYLLGSADSYGTIYVPFGDTWVAGKRHIYTLIFGGGYTDQGEAVLNPIQFDAETTGWVDANSNVNVKP